MSLVTDILNRLSGISAVREQINMTAHRVERLADMLIDHEKRLIRIEVSIGAPPCAPIPKTLPRHKKR